MNARSERPSLPAFLERRRLDLPMSLAFAAARGPFRVWTERLGTLWRAELPECDTPAEGLCDGEGVTLAFSTGAQAEGVLLRPSGPGPHPAILLLHEHGGSFDCGWEKMLDLPASQDTRTRLYEGRAPAQAFLEAGFAVLCLDAPGWGRRSQGGAEAQQALAANAMGLGWSLAGLVAAEDVQTALWLARQPGIDATRIGAFGFSWGGFRAWQVAALCGSVKAHASLSWMACRADLMRPGAPLLRGQSAFWMLHPGLAHHADFPDLAGLCGAKPQFYRSGRGDRHMPEDSVARAWDTLSVIAAAAGGPPPDTGFHDHAHTCPSETLDEAVAFLSRQL